ncbi:NUDIX domain-containing protein [Parabacteroides sp. OttesenSCG-928-G07]|nr:NUDIX domain-containing protein [Parabacteroides sp. OttesenSCG-928-G07]
MIYPHLSVDCVILGIQEGELSVLLIERRSQEGELLGYKLPGNMIYENEDLDEAANRVLTDATGLKNVILKQFRSFGSLTRTQNRENLEWLQKKYNVKFSRIVTIAYLALAKNSRKIASEALGTTRWFPANQVPQMPFDHNLILQEAIKEIRTWVEREPAIIFEYLPVKFTEYQLRQTYEVIYNKKMDVRNFHKKMLSLEYVVLTDEVQLGVAHRAARYYRFDKVKYNRQRSKLNKN